MKKIVAVFLAVSLLIVSASAIAPPIPENAAGAALLMEKETGSILYEENAHQKLESASVTKVMTLLLIMEAIDEGRLKLDDVVTVSPNAASMGGSQIWLKEGEQMCVDDLLKAIAVVSANDASVALAEQVYGSETAFVNRMNERANELGMKDTTFLNCTGLPASGHLTSAYDIALMSRALLAHELVLSYTTIWMDSLRDGKSELVNTNRLIRFYPGTTGLKTGSTDSALYCLAATATRDGMDLIAVILKSPTSAQRFDAAKSLLDYGFANYALVDVYPNRVIPPIDVILGETREIQPVLARSSRILVEKGGANDITSTLNLAKDVEAPVEAGQKLGEMVVMLKDKVVETIPIISPENVNRLTLPGIFGRLLQSLFMVG